jgi:hypothetical protein
MPVDCTYVRTDRGIEARLFSVGETSRLRSKPLNEFYKKGCQEKSSASTGGERNLVSRSSPLFSYPPPILFERFFALACLLFPRGHLPVVTMPIEF